MGGGDKIFHKRKAKQASDLKRRQAKKAPYDKVLIVCEGEKTERKYFSELRDHYRLNTTNIEICGDCGSAPINVIDKAKQLYREEIRKQLPFDRVYCVFDRDSHDSYDQAIAAIQSAKPKDTFYVINSVPCFEFWLLLHFEFTAKPFYATTGVKSACDRVQEKLKQYIPNYAKGDNGHFDALINELPRAIKHAKQVLAGSRRDGSDNPCTRVPELVEYLQGLLSPQEKEN
jgi:hypothetical protein